LQVTEVHLVSLGYVKAQGDVFCLPAPTPASGETIHPVATTMVDDVNFKLSDRVRGVVKTINPAGFGFLKVEGMAKFIFFHFKVLPAGVKAVEGQVFDLTIGENDRGFIATALALVETEEGKTLAVETTSADANAAPVGEAKERPKLVRKSKPKLQQPVPVKTGADAGVSDTAIAAAFAEATQAA
jgi:cold shock CspA family protein